MTRRLLRWRSPRRWPAQAALRRQAEPCSRCPTRARWPPATLESRRYFAQVESAQEPSASSEGSQARGTKGTRGRAQEVRPRDPWRLGSRKCPGGQEDRGRAHLKYVAGQLFLPTTPIVWQLKMKS